MTESKKNSRTRGLGFVYQPTYRNRKTGEQRRSAKWWIQYSFRGRIYRESSASAQRSDAVKLLRRRVAEMGRGRLIGPDVERTTLDELVTILLNDYRANRRRSLDRVEDAVTHLQAFFGAARAVEITGDRVIAYVAARQRDDAANATINRELAALKRMFRLGERAGRVNQGPPVSMLTEDNVRTGFFEPDQFHAVLRHLPDELRPVLEVEPISPAGELSPRFSRASGSTSTSPADGFASSPERRRTATVACSH